MQQRHVLILSASYGQGHHQASKAIELAFQSKYPDTRVTIVDFMELVHPILNAMTRYLYIKSLKVAPRLYRYFYEHTGDIPPQSVIQRKGNQLGWEKLLDYLHIQRPDLVISTFPMPSGVMSYLKSKGLTDLPCVTVITDFTIHNQWLHGNIEKYFVGAESIKQGLIKKGIPTDQIIASGIPVRPDFAQALDKQQLKKAYGLNQHLLTILIMGGAFGVLPDIGAICQMFVKRTDMQVIIICGKDKEMKAKVEQAIGYDSRARVLGFVENIHEVMAVTDLMITKAGGLTVSEALCSHTPMLIYRTIPGQEDQNARFLQRHGAALMINGLDQLVQTVDHLLKTPQLLENMKQSTQMLAKPYAGQTIATACDEMMTQQQRYQLVY